VWGGAVSAIALAVIGGAIVAFAGGVEPLLASFRDSYTRLLQDASANPSSSVIRLDAVALASRALGHSRHRHRREGDLHRRALRRSAVRVGGRRNTRRRSPAALVVRRVLMILNSRTHQAYDALLLALPAVALVTAGDASAISRVLGRNTRRLLLALLRCRR